MATINPGDWVTVLYHVTVFNEDREEWYDSEDSIAGQVHAVDSFGVLLVGWRNESAGSSDERFFLYGHFGEGFKLLLPWHNIRGIAI